jgi:hypothetical protein
MCKACAHQVAGQALLLLLLLLLLLQFELHMLPADASMRQLELRQASKHQLTAWLHSEVHTLI